MVRFLILGTVAPEHKFAARYLARYTLRAIDFGGAERVVRINQESVGLTDLDILLPGLCTRG